MKTNKYKRTKSVMKVKQEEYKQEVSTRARIRSFHKLSGETSEGEEEASRFTLFLIGAASFAVGFWGIACLVKAMMDQGPVAMIKQLTIAVLGQ